MRRFGRPRRLRRRRNIFWKRPAFDPPPSPALTIGQPELKFVADIGQALFSYLAGKFPKWFGASSGELEAEELRALKAVIIPEALEPIETAINERQEGRSEVVREIAKPKDS